MKKRTIKISIILITLLFSIFFAYKYVENFLILDAILNAGILIISLIIKEKDKFLFYSALILPIIVAVLFGISLWINSPKIDVEFGHFIIVPDQNPQGNLFGYFRLNNFEWLIVSPQDKYKNFPGTYGYFQNYSGNSTIPNRYNIQISNGGSKPIKNLKLYIHTSYIIRDEDIINKDSRIILSRDEGTFISGRSILTIPNLDLRENISFIFKNLEPQDVQLEKCLIDDEPIVCNNITYDLFVFKMPEDRKIHLSNGLKFPFMEYTGEGTILTLPKKENGVICFLHRDKDDCESFIPYNPECSAPPACQLN